MYPAAGSGRPKDPNFWRESWIRHRLCKHPEQGRNSRPAARPGRHRHADSERRSNNCIFVARSFQLVQACCLHGFGCPDSRIVCHCVITRNMAIYSVGPLYNSDRWRACLPHWEHESARRACRYYHRVIFKARGMFLFTPTRKEARPGPRRTTSSARTA